MTRRKTYAEFVERYGTLFPSMQVPHTTAAQILHDDDWAPAACWYNAARLVLKSKEEPLTYVENVKHAWVVDANGHVIETTWGKIDVEQFTERGWTYFGVPYCTDWLRSVVGWWGGLVVRDETLPSLEFLVFNRPKEFGDAHGWRALAAGVLKGGDQ